MSGTTHSAALADPDDRELFARHAERARQPQRQIASAPQTSPARQASETSIEQRRRELFDRINALPATSPRRHKLEGQLIEATREALMIETGRSKP